MLAALHLANRGLEVASVEDRRNSQALDDYGFLPPSRDVQALLSYLKQAGVTCYSGWQYFANNFPLDSIRERIAEMPHIACGVVVAEKDFKLVGEVGSDRSRDRNLPSLSAPVAVAPVSALGTERLRSCRVFGPESDAYFDSNSATEERKRLSRITEVKLAPSFQQIFTRAAGVALDTPVLGVKTSKAFKGVTDYTKRQVRETISEHIVTGRTVDDTARELGKVMDINERAATRIARTNINAAQNNAHRMVYDSNPDVFVGYRWDSTLDHRTSRICATLDGTFWPTGSNPPGPPAHPNCRSTLIGVFKDPELQAVVDEAPRRARDEDDKGTTVDGRTRYEQWLRGQDHKLKRRILGSDTKLELWEQKKIKLDDVLADDLTTRSDKAVVERAMARRPKDKRLKKLGKELGAKRRSLESIERSELRMARKTKWDVGQRSDAKKALAEKKQRIDDKKSAAPMSKLGKKAAKKKAYGGGDEPPTRPPATAKPKTKKAIKKARRQADRLDASDAPSELQEKIDSGIQKEVYKIVEGDELECHQMVSDITHRVGDKRPWWGEHATEVMWDEDKWDDVAAELAKAPKFRNKKVRELVEDIKDFSVNGHSFMRVRSKWVDPMLHHAGVPDPDIQEFNEYLFGVYKKVGMKERAVLKGRPIPTIVNERHKSRPDVINEQTRSGSEMILARALIARRGLARVLARSGTVKEPEWCYSSRRGNGLQKANPRKCTAQLPLCNAQNCACIHGSPE